MESAITIRRPASTRASPTGAVPTWTRASSARAGSVRRRPAENPSSALLPRAVTHTTWPLAEVMTRTGWQPAATVDTTACAGSVAARGTLMTERLPRPPRAPPQATSLVA
ncbi:MAG TPA: hypothetical protein VN597_07545 [Streptosporangiaceae bacterium]|nr:hypothetical protein [Streptosporangiaceae bacterium]